MNSYRSYGRRRYGAYRRRYGYGRSWRRNWYRYGSRAGAMQRNGRRSFTLSVPVEQIYTMSIAANSAFSNLLRTVPYMHPIGAAATTANRNSSAQSLLENAAYNMYTKLYDQVKIVSVSHRVYICNPVGVSGGLPSMKVYTAWDRDWTYGDQPLTMNDLLNGPESQSQMFVTNSRAEFTRAIRATDLQERTQFHDCSIENNSAGTYQGDIEVMEYHNPIGFNPSMSMAFEASDKTAADRSFQVSISSRYVVVFRNPKFGLSNYQPSNAKLSFGGEGDDSAKSDDKKVTFSDEVKKDVGDLGEDDVLMGDLPEIKEA